MSQELLYTSAPRGLRSGSQGYCTVVATKGLSPALAERLEALSAYRPLFPPHDERARLNPVNYSHLRIQVGGKTYSVLSRIGPAGLDYTGRGNKLAHHVVLEAGELPEAGPAWLLAQPGFMENQWDGRVQTLAVGRTPPSKASLEGDGLTGGTLSGEAGFGGALAAAFREDRMRPVYLVFELGFDVLALVAESIALLPAEVRWDVTFSTYFTGLPQGVACAWRAVPKGAEGSITDNANARVIQLGRDAALADGSTYPSATASARIPRRIMGDSFGQMASVESDPDRPIAVPTNVATRELNSFTPPQIPPPLRAESNVGKGKAWIAGIGLGAIGGLAVGLAVAVAFPSVFGKSQAANDKAELGVQQLAAAEGGPANVAQNAELKAQLAENADKLHRLEKLEQAHGKRLELAVIQADAQHEQLAEKQKVIEVLQAEVRKVRTDKEALVLQMHALEKKGNTKTDANGKAAAGFQVLPLNLALPLSDAKSSIKLPAGVDVVNSSIRLTELDKKVFENELVKHRIGERELDVVLKIGDKKEGLARFRVENDHLFFEWLSAAKDKNHVQARRKIRNAILEISEPNKAPIQVGLLWDSSKDGRFTKEFAFPDQKTRDEKSIKDKFGREETKPLHRPFIVAAQCEVESNSSNVDSNRMRLRWDDEIELRYEDGENGPSIVAEWKGHGPAPAKVRLKYLVLGVKIGDSIVKVLEAGTK